jgi:hypothetical protein
VELLLYRSGLLGSDLRLTNYGGGNTSAKLPATDPVTDEPVDVLWVKGSGGDLASIGLDGFATLYVSKLQRAEEALPRDRARGRQGSTRPSLESPLALKRIAQPNPAFPRANSTTALRFSPQQADSFRPAERAFSFVSNGLARTLSQADPRKQPGTPNFRLTTNDNLIIVYR